MKNTMTKVLLTSAAIISSATAYSEVLPGLWFGVAEVTQVNEVFHDSTDKTTTKAVKYPFNLQLVLHTDKSGSTKLLREVFVMQTKGDTNKQRVLITDQAKITNYEGIIKRGDNKLSAVRFVSPSFDFGTDTSVQELALTGSIDRTNNTKITGSITLDKNHPLNPMRHQYNPAHKEGLTISRNFTITIQQPVAGKKVKPSQGKTLLSGTYEETLTGLHKEILKVSGNIQLNRVSNITKLNSVDGS